MAPVPVAVQRLGVVGDECPAGVAHEWSRSGVLSEAVLDSGSAESEVIPETAHGPTLGADSDLRRQGMRVQGKSDGVPTALWSGRSSCVRCEAVGVGLGSIVTIPPHRHLSPGAPPMASGLTHICRRAAARAAAAGKTV